MESLKKSSYEEWLFYYRTNNLSWYQLSKQQQFALMCMYKRQLHIKVISLDNIANNIKKDLTFNSDCSIAEASALTNCIRYRLAI